MKRLSLLVLGVVLAFGVGGCAKRQNTQPTPNGGQVVSDGTTTNKVGSDGTTPGRSLPLPGVSLSTSASDAGTSLATVYFAYDSSEIASQYNDAINSAARRLTQSGSMRLRLEGNTDERGAAEYNIALGERRAQAVKRALVLAGAPESQLLTVSYGAERPAVEGHDESAWSKNRRVDVVALGGTP